MWFLAGTSLSLRGTTQLLLCVEHSLPQNGSAKLCDSERQQTNTSHKPARQTASPLHQRPCNAASVLQYIRWRHIRTTAQWLGSRLMLQIMGVANKDTQRLGSRCTTSAFFPKRCIQATPKQRLVAAWCSSAALMSSRSIPRCPTHLVCCVLHLVSHCVSGAADAMAC